MAVINVLDKNVAELIAAGEVIERPASVLKELIENSVDAGANQITVEIKSGGIEYIRVTDNGCGIAAEDLPTAFLRHATSKVKNASDLDNILTMGFRGEALASIAAVSHVEVISKTAGNEFGAYYKISGSVPEDSGETGAPDGTSVIIRDLFYNTPARLKFLKKDSTEGNYVQNVVSKLALSYPEVCFRFIRDGKQVLTTAGDGKYYSAIYSVLGKQFAASLISVDFSINGIEVKGYISAPFFARSNRTMQYFFVNTRSIKNTTCTAALEEGCRNSVMTGKFPSCVLHIFINASEVDVNVSPSKTEVRFANEKTVFNAVYLAVKNAVLNSNVTKEIDSGAIRNDTFADNAGNEKSEEKTVPDFAVGIKEEKKQEPEKLPENSIKESVEKAENSTAVLPTVRVSESYEQTFCDDNSDEPEMINPFKYIDKNSLKKIKRQDVSAAAEVRNVSRELPLRFVGEIFKTYIICEHGDELVIIDKHAAHERIRFEKLKTELSSNSQILANSVKVTVSGEEYAALSSFVDELYDIGMEIIPGDNNEIEITALPTMLDHANEKELLEIIASSLINNNDHSKEELFYGILHSMACKSAIKANDDNSELELEKLAGEVWCNKQIRYCPHGRPVITVITKYNLEKQFGRIQ